jgi:formylglycine-generating enzyme required for sulfatase activity
MTKHKDTKAQRHKEKPQYKNLCMRLFFVSLCLCVFVFPVLLLAQEPGMKLIPGGDFWMGRTHMFQFDELNWLARPRLDDQPARPVGVDAFYIDIYEVTNSDYAKFADATKRSRPWNWKDGQVNPGQERWPVYNVTWDDAAAYCAWAGKRLPTEAEWEKAARGGADKKIYPWGDTLEPEGEAKDAKKTMKLARYAFPNGPVPVGSYPANGYGLFDMIGNVWEWTSDWYTQYYYSVAPSKNPRGPDTGKYRVLRGGGWATDAAGGGGGVPLLAVHYRNYAPGDQTSNVVGFRCARDAK